MIKVSAKSHSSQVLTDAQKLATEVIFNIVSTNNKPAVDPSITDL